MVNICIRRISGASSRRNGNYDIDDFINQLLASQKFDELAEKVADKAVKKIKNMETGTTFVEKDISNKNENDEEEIPHRYEEKKRALEDKGVVFKEREQRSSNKGENIKPGTINTEVLLKKDDDSSQADALTLKYKNFKQHVKEKKAPAHNSEHSGSDEHNPLWRNVENSDEKKKLRHLPIEEREQEPIQVRPARHNSGEKEDKDYERNKFDRNTNYVKNNQKPSNKNHENDHERYSKGSDNENYKSRFSDQHERDENTPRKHKDTDEQDRESTNIDKQDDEQNERPRFKSEHAAQSKDEDSTPVIIDLDDNFETHYSKHVTTEEPTNVYKEISEKQKRARMDDENDEEEEERKIREDGIVFVNDQKVAREDKNRQTDNSDEDDAYKVITDNENGVTAGDGTTTKKQVIRREGNRLYTYLSAPEYAEYHDLLAKQTKNPNYPFDMK